MNAAKLSGLSLQTFRERRACCGARSAQLPVLKVCAQSAGKWRRTCSWNRSPAAMAVTDASRAGVASASRAAPAARARVGTLLARRPPLDPERFDGWLAAHASRILRPPKPQLNPLRERGALRRARRHPLRWASARRARRCGKAGTYPRFLRGARRGDGTRSTGGQRAASRRTRPLFDAGAQVASIHCPLVSCEAVASSRARRLPARCASTRRPVPLPFPHRHASRASPRAASALSMVLREPVERFLSAYNFCASGRTARAGCASQLPATRAANGPSRGKCRAS